MTNKTILIVDDMAIFRDPLAACLKLAGYDAVCAADGKAALAVLAQRKVDLVLLDIAMPGMDGLTALSILRKDPAYAKTPVILLTALAERKYVVQAASLGVQAYLLKSRFSLTEMLTRVKGLLADAMSGARNESSSGAVPSGSGASGSAALPAAPVDVPTAGEPADPLAPDAPTSTGSAPAPARRSAAGIVEIRQLLTREQCLARAASALGAKTLSGVVAQVMAMASSPRGDLAELATLIARDPALSARVLQAANSPAFASKRGVVSNIPDAVRHIGCATIRNIATAFGVFEAMPETGADGFNPIRCWQHSFAVAVLCEHLCKPHYPDLAGTAYIVGLCHDLGEILFRTHFGNEYRQVLETARASGQTVPQLERQMLGISHADLLRAIVEQIGLPESIRDTIEALHDEKSSKGNQAIVRVLRLADMYASAIGLASSGSARVRPLTRGECKSATGNENPETPDRDQLRGEIFALTAALARLNPREQDELMQPMHTRTDARIWLSRGTSFATFDPVAAALESVAEVSIHARLPNGPAEFADHSAIVIACKGGSSEALPPAELSKLSAAHGGVPVLLLSTGATAILGEERARVHPALVTLDELAAFAVSARAAAARAA